jgi:plasmid stability protein
MEAEIRAILTEAVSPVTDSIGLAQTILARFGDLGGIELDLPARTQSPRGADLRS